MAIPPYLRREHARLTPKALAPGNAGKPGGWYSIVNGVQLKDEQGGGTGAEIFIYDEIGGWGIMAADFVRELQAIDAPTLLVRLSSPGGEVFEALAILNSLRQHPATVRVVVEGLAASAASVIAMAGDTIEVAPGAMMMIHDAMGVAVGNAAEVRSLADLLEKTSANIADIYAERAGGTAEEWRTAMLAETWYNADEAVAAGLADSVLNASDKTTATAKAPQLVNQIPTPAPAVVDFAEILRAAVKEAVS